MGTIRLSRLRMGDFRAPVSTISLSLPGESQISPFDFDLLRALIVRSILNEYLHFPDLSPIILRIDSTSISTPRDFSAVSFANIRSLVDTWHVYESILHMRQALAIATEPRGRRLTSLPLEPNESLAAQAFRVKDIDDSAPFQRRREMANVSALPIDFERAIPRAKIKAVSKASADTDSINRFRDAGVAMYVARQKIDPLPIVEACISRYAVFCELVRDPYSPPTAARVKRCGISPKMGRLFRFTLSISRRHVESSI